MQKVGGNKRDGGRNERNRLEADWIKRERRGRREIDR